MIKYDVVLNILLFTGIAAAAYGFIAFVRWVYLKWEDYAYSGVIQCHLCKDDTVHYCGFCTECGNWREF